MEQEDLDTQEYTWPRTVGFLLEELSVLASEMLKLSGSVLKKVVWGGTRVPVTGNTECGGKTRYAT